MSIPFPTAIDSSMRSAFVSCPRSFYWQYLRHLRRSSFNINTHFGGVFAHAMEITRKAYFSHTSPHHDNESASLRAGAETIMTDWGDVDAPEKSSKTLLNCLSAFQAYYEEYPLPTNRVRPHLINGEPLVECSFAIPLKTLHPTTREPIIYCGRFDMVGESDGSLFVVDEKTTTMMGQAWEKQFQTRAQMTGYCYAASTWGLPIAGCIIRGVGIYRAAPVIRFGQPIVYRPQWQILQWQHQLERDVARMVAAWQAGEWDQNLDHACSAYGGCAYIDLCTSENPENWLDDFVISPWNPLRLPDVGGIE